MFRRPLADPAEAAPAAGDHGVVPASTIESPTPGRRPPPEPAPVPEAATEAGSATDTTDTSGERGRRPARRRAGLLVGSVLLLVAAGCWWWAVTTTNTAYLGQYGLLPVLPWSWYLGLAVAVAVAVGGVLVGTSSTRLMAAACTLLVLILYGTTTVVEAAPHLPWVYKHIGVTRYIELHGSVHRSIDIYQRWPGFFSLTAFLGELTGSTDPLTYVAWFEPLAVLAEVGLVVALARLVWPDRRWYWSAALTFILANWVGQNYFSPQAFAFLLYLGMCVLTLTFLMAEPGRFGRGLERLTGALTRSRATVGAPGAQRPGPQPGQPAGALDAGGGPRALSGASARGGRVLAVVAVLLLQAVISASHQLTPYIVVLTLFPLFVLGYARPRWVGLGLLALPLAYLVPNLSYVESNFGLFSSLDPAKNATYTPVDRAELPAAFLLQGRVVTAIALFVWLLAVIGLVRRARAGYRRSALIVGWFAFAPALTLAAQSYGGEGRLRVFLFSLAWSALAAAWCFRPGPGPRRHPVLSALPGVVALLVLAPAFVFAQFQPEGDYQIAAGEVVSSQWLYANAPAGSAVVLLDSQVPLGFEANYPALATGTSIEVEKAYFADPLAIRSVEAIESSLHIPPGANRYLYLTGSQDRYAIEHGLFTRAQLDQLTTRLAADPDFQVVYSSNTSRIYRYTPGP